MQEEWYRELNINCTSQYQITDDRIVASRLAQGQTEVVNNGHSRLVITNDRIVANILAQNQTNVVNNGHSRLVFGCAWDWSDVILRVCLSTYTLGTCMQNKKSVTELY